MGKEMQAGYFLFSFFGINNMQNGMDSHGLYLLMGRRAVQSMNLKVTETIGAILETDSWSSICLLQ